MNQPFWKKLSTRTLLSHPRITVVADEVLLPSGKQVEYIRYENLSDYVTVIARRGSQMALLKEYSYPHDEWLWQFPEGSIEAGETPESSAVRELQEEAGLAANQWRQLGTNHSHHRRSVEENFIFVAQEAYEIEKAVGDEEEAGTELHWVEESEVREMVANGKIVQKNALAALALYFVADSK